MEGNYPSYKTYRAYYDWHSRYNYCPFNRIVSEVKVDPATIGLALTAASKAFGAIKKGFAIGKDVESMGKDLGRWLSAVSDVDNTEKKAKNPSLLQKLFKGDDVKTSAIEAFTAKKKLEAQRQELKSFINFHYGANSWNEILHMEGQIRKQRQKEIYERQELRRKIAEWIGIVLLCCTIIGFIVFLAWLYKEKRG